MAFTNHNGVFPLLLALAIVGIASAATRIPCPRTFQGTNIIIDYTENTANLNCFVNNPNFVLATSVKELNGLERRQFEIHARTTGWVAVGLNNSPLMSEADITIGWVAGGGNVHIYDAYVPSNVRGVTQDPGYPDVGQNFQIVSATEENGVTKFVYSRPLRAVQIGYDHIADGQIYTLWAFGSSDPINFAGIAAHDATSRGVIEYTLTGSACGVVVSPFLFLLLCVSALLTWK